MSEYLASITLNSGVVVGGRFQPIAAGDLPTATMFVGESITGGGANRVLFAGTTQLLSESASFTWSNAGSLLTATNIYAPGTVTCNNLSVDVGGSIFAGTVNSSSVSTEGHFTTNLQAAPTILGSNQSAWWFLGGTDAAYVRFDVRNGSNTQISIAIPMTLFAHHANAGNVTTGETDLYSDTIAASRLAANDETLEAEYGGVFVSSATATREIKLYFGGTMFFDSGALTLSLSAAWTIYVSLIRVSATVVRYMVSMTTEGAALAAYTAVGEITGLTLSNTNILKITGQAAGVGANTNDIVAYMSKVVWQPAP